MQREQLILFPQPPLALAAAAYSDETWVDFETVWAQGHTEAERTGSSTTNFIEWLHACMAAG